MPYIQDVDPKTGYSQAQRDIKPRPGSGGDGDTENSNELTQCIVNVGKAKADPKSPHLSNLRQMRSTCGSPGC